MSRAWVIEIHLRLVLLEEARLKLDVSGLVAIDWDVGLANANKCGCKCAYTPWTLPKPAA